MGALSVVGALAARPNEVSGVSGPGAGPARPSSSRRDFIAHAHRAGLPVRIWTVDAREDMQRLLDWGADSIISDRPMSRSMW